MALNHLMHPQNIYKTPPNFSQLAEKFPEFSNITKIDATGKVTIDFKDPHSLRILTKCLLKSDFDLDIDIPEDRLVPTLPLRLNYILWIDDIMATIGRYDDICGIDIGTGACAIYTLLGASMYYWNMIGTETEEQSLDKAIENIEKNSLGDLIKLKHTSSSSVIVEVLNSEPDTVFDFTMCNPPFYSNVEELCESRHPSRRQPKNAFTGSPHELITEGGELEFCKKMLRESMNHKNRVRVFTTMVGHKFNFKELMLELQANNIKYTHTTFCQGRVTRWGLAWTYQDYKIESLHPSKGNKERKNNSISYVIPALPNTPVCINLYTEKLQKIVTELKIDWKLIHKRKFKILMQLISYKNTWTHQRRKRRLLKRMEAKRIKLSDSTSEDNCIEDSTKQEHVNNNVEDESKETILNDEQKSPIINARMTVSQKNNVITLELAYIDGSSGKDGLHQILQYIKNNWK